MLVADITFNVSSSIAGYNAQCRDENGLTKNCTVNIAGELVDEYKVCSVLICMHLYYYYYYYTTILTRCVINQRMWKII